MEAVTNPAPPLDPAELIKLCAVDSDLFAHTFFPKATRQKSPPFSKQIWASLENPKRRLLNIEAFRGSAKTTRLRIFTAKRIAYGISRTILYVGASESHAVRSIQWLRSQIEPRLMGDGSLRPTPFASTFGLRPGKKWQEHEIEVFHGIDVHPIWILGVGITGNIRGINFDDYRPDLIVVDDVLTDENAQTQEQCNKINDLVMGALANSLTQEEVSAKLVMLNTPISPFDVCQKAKESSEWYSEHYGCWTADTENLPVEQQESSWPELFPTAQLRERKINATLDNRYSIFAREMECKLVAAESLSFRPNWLRYYEPDQLPKGMQCVLVIDPVPPPSEKASAKALAKKDYESIAVVGRSKGEYYLLDYAMSRGHDPNWTVAKMFELGMRYRVLRVVVESVAYQRVLKWLLEKEMQRRGIYFATKDTGNDRRPKFVRIVTSLSGVASQGHLWCRKEHSDFILQFQGYGPGYKGHDDVLETVAIGVSELTNPYLELGATDYEEINPTEPFPFRAACP